MTGHEERISGCAMEGWTGHMGAFLHREGGQALEQAAQGRGRALSLEVSVTWLGHHRTGLSRSWLDLVTLKVFCNLDYSMMLLFQNLFIF